MVRRSILALLIRKSLGKGPNSPRGRFKKLWFTLVGRRRAELNGLVKVFGPKLVP